MQVVLTFSMQGVGNFTNTAVLCILLVIFGSAVPNHHNKAYPYHTNRCVHLAEDFTWPYINALIESWKRATSIQQVMRSTTHLAVEEE